MYGVHFGKIRNEAIARKNQLCLKVCSGNQDDLEQFNCKISIQLIA